MSRPWFTKRFWAGLRGRTGPGKLAQTHLTWFFYPRHSCSSPPLSAHGPGVRAAGAARGARDASKTEVTAGMDRAILGPGLGVWLPWAGRCSGYFKEERGWGPPMRVGKASGGARRIR